ncbi:MAG: sulfotransferase [Microlunatus sp.]
MALRNWVTNQFDDLARASRRMIAPARLRKAQVRWMYPDGPDRLVSSPVFLFSPTRSGSTLLRSILNSHSQICAPHELHLNRLSVTTTKKFAARAMDELGMTTDDLENLLWDRVLHRQLIASRKSIIVDKTPHNVIFWSRIAAAWPNARYLYLIRHPAAIARSHAEARPHVSYDTHIGAVLKYAPHIDAAREALPGPTVRYEELVTDPEQTTKEICSWLGVRWERSMLEYGKFSQGSYRRQGIGDWSENIRSGEIKPLRPAPETPPELAHVARAWGY